MEAATPAKTSGVDFSSKTEKIRADPGSHKIDVVFSFSNEQNEIGQADLKSLGKNFELIDSLYSAAAEGDIDKFKQHANLLDRLLTPKQNTILHIHITARAKAPQTNIWEKISLKKKSEAGIHRESFVSEVLEMCPDLLWMANTKGETLLHIAARHGHADIVKILIEKCKKPHQKDQGNGIEATRLMLGKTNEDKDAALHEAVRYNHLDVVEILTREDPNLSYGANSAAETPLYLAAERGYKEIVKEILFTCKSPADHGPVGRTALHAAVIFRDKEITRLLLENKRTLTSRADKEGWVPLHCAAYFGSIHILKELLQADKSAAYKADNDGKTALHVAAGRGEVVIMEEIILSCPGCCELVDNRGWNIFHFALDSKNENAVQLLLENPSLGNLINERDNKGNKPLHQHAASGSYISSFVGHPKVDKAAFNHQNQNSMGIIEAKGLLSPLERSFWWCLKNRLKGKWGYRIIMSREEGEDGKDKDDNISNKSDIDGREKKKRDDAMEKDTQKSKDANLVVATLVATVAFTAGITLPGGYIDEEGPDQGTAVLTRSIAFQAFVITNAIAMIFSSCAVFINLFVTQFRNKMTELHLVKLGRLFIIYAMFAMVLAFVMGTYTVLYRADKMLAISVCVIASLFFLVRTCYEPHLILNMLRIFIVEIYFKLKTVLMSRIHLHP